VSNTKSPDSAGKGDDAHGAPNKNKRTPSDRVKPESDALDAQDPDPKDLDLDESEPDAAVDESDAPDADPPDAADPTDSDSADADPTDGAAASQSDELTVKPYAKRWWIIGSVALVVIIIDQITKIWAVDALADKNIDLIWGARFNLVFNTGSAFSIGQGFGRWLSLLIVFVIIAVLAYARTIASRGMTILFGLVIGGAIGNLIDRLVRAEDGFMTGGVVDFIDIVRWWGIFNVADMAVVCGAFGLFVLGMREPA